MADNTSKIDQEQIAGVIVNSVTGPSVNSTDPKNVIIPEIPSVMDVGNKANKDGSNTNGGVWQIDYIMSEVLPVNKSVLRVFANGTIEYGSDTLKKHVFDVDNANGLKVKVNGIEGDVWTAFNFEPSDYLNKNEANEISDEFRLVSGATEYKLGDNMFSISFANSNINFSTHDGFEMYDQNGNITGFYQAGLQFNQAKINVKPNFQTNVNIPITGATLSTLATAVKYNGVSKFATDNGVIDLGELIVEEDLNGFVYDVTYATDTHVLTFFRKNLPNVVVDLPLESLVKDISLENIDGSDFLKLSKENGTFVYVPLNMLLVGVQKSTNGIPADINGNVTLNISDIPGLSSALDSKAGMNDQRILNGQIAYDKLNSVESVLDTVNWYRIAKGTLQGGSGCSFIVIIERTYNNFNNESYTFSVNTAYGGNTTITQLSGVYNSKLISSIRVVNTNADVVHLDVKYESTYFNDIKVRVFGSAEAIPATIAPTVTTGASELETTNGMAVLGNGTSSQWNQVYLWGNHANAGYALLSQVYTQSQALATFVPINGVSTINGTKTFSSSPVVPNATLNNHAVNLGQLANYANARLSNLAWGLSASEQEIIRQKLGINTSPGGNEVNVFDLYVASQFQALIDSIAGASIYHSKAYFRGKTLGISIAIGNSNTSVDVAILNASIGYNMFEFPLEIMERLNNEIVEMVPNLKLNTDEFMHGLNNGTSYISFSDGRVNHTGNLVVKRNSKLVLTAEFECLNN